ncbi:MAG: DUF3560 domain-containing protein [Synergistaceae bacterium]|nr:DUF3560 domain-containing protein [Synergistaceae bacterium]
MAIGREDYEDRKAAHIDKLNDAAYKASEEAQAQCDRAHRIAEHIPFGQPILVGHHSEKHARRDAEKIDRAMQNSVKMTEKADYYTSLAESAANNTAISSDDPNALEKLAEKIEVLQEKQTQMKAVNAYWRKHKTMKGCPGVSDDGAAKIDEQMKTAYSWVQENGPFERWKLSNNNANIKRLKDRLAQLQRLDEMPAEIIRFDGGEIDVDIADNRVKVRFDKRQDEETTTKLKSSGFKWSRSNQCWQRLRTKNALYAARRICGVGR